MTVEPTAADVIEGWKHKLADVSHDRRIVCEIAIEAIEALRLADLYLDGFVWTTEPEFSELQRIKAASKRAQQRWAERGEGL